MDKLLFVAGAHYLINNAMRSKGGMSHTLLHTTSEREHLRFISFFIM